MKTSRKLKHISILACVFFIGMALQFTGCSAPSPTTAVKVMPPLSSVYIIPSTLDTFNVGLIHNAELYYIFTHYDTVKYASYPRKFSQAGIDSLAALFITDSIQPSSGYYTPSEISLAEATFDSAFNACLTALPTHNQFIASIDTGEAHGYLATDEGSFIINADTDIRLCASFAQTNDTISSLIAQYNSITWALSTSHGGTAYEYLNMANHSCKFWGQPGDTVPVHPPVSADAQATATAKIYAAWMMSTGGWSQTDANIYISQAGPSASAGSSMNSYNAGVKFARITAAIVTVITLILIALILF